MFLSGQNVDLPVPGKISQENDGGRSRGGVRGRGLKSPVAIAQQDVYVVGIDGAHHEIEYAVISETGGGGIECIRR